MKTKIKVVETFIEEQISQLREEHRYGTANNYEKTMRSLLVYLGNKKLTFSNFDKQLIADYNTYLTRKGLQAISFSHQHLQQEFRSFIGNDRKWL